MPTNVFFSPKVSTEQFMYEDIIIESIKMYGQDVYYLPRKIVQRDYILGEEVESQFNSANTVEMFIENTEGFEGEGNIFAKFGMEIRDEATFIVAKRSWQRVVGIYNSDINSERPQEGDLIYLPLSKSFFEISFVEHEQPFYQLSNLPIFKCQARLFEFSDEEFNTGISEVDGIETQFAYQEVFEYGSLSGTFTLGERVKHILTASVVADAAATATLTNGKIAAFTTSTSGFGYTAAPAVTIQDHDNSNKELTNFRVTQAEPKFGSWGAYAANSTKFVDIEHTASLNAGTVEFFFKTKADENFTGELANFGDFKFELASGNQITSRYKTASQSTSYTGDDWNHVKVSCTRYNGGTQTQYQIYINGTRVLEATQTDGDVILIGDGYYGDDNSAKLLGINSTTNTAETNGVYFDATCVDSTGLLNVGSITVPTSMPSLDLINESFDPVRAAATATINNDGEVTGFTIVEAGKFYPSVPTVTIAESPDDDIAEVNVSANIVTYDNNTMYIRQIETSDGEYHTFAKGQSITGADSGATATITKYFDVATSDIDNTFTEDPAARNFNFEDEADDIIDFSESNPFGDAT